MPITALIIGASSVLPSMVIAAACRFSASIANGHIYALAQVRPV